MYCTGNLRVDKKDNSKHLMPEKLQQGVNKSLFHVNKMEFMLAKWSDKCTVNYISIEFGNGTGNFHSAERDIITENPVVILSYNKFLSGIDWQDQMMAYYPCSQVCYMNTYYIQSKLTVAVFMIFLLEIIRKLLSSCTTLNIHPIIKPTKYYTHRISKIEKTGNREMNESTTVCRK